jgi:hypothetical protein
MTHQVKKTFNGWLVDGRKHGRSNGEVHNMRNATQKVIFKDGSIYFYWNDMLHGHQLDTGGTAFIDTFNKGVEQGISYRI